MGVIIGGNDWDIINQALDTNFVEVTYNKPIKNFIINIRGNSSVFMKRQTADSKFFTIKNGGNLPFGLPIANAGASASSLGWFATDAGTDTVEFIVIF